jgi:4-hydroxybenzoate polyprenyltransferase
MSRITKYLQLMRITNVFTSVADIWAGFLFAGGLLDRFTEVLLLSLASAALYCAGMVFNDVFDAKQDATERPDRPIPSGRISRSSAAMFGVSLLAAGLVIIWLTIPGVGPIAGVLAAAIIFYDAIIKNTPLAPAVMGLCRALNLAMGMALAAATFSSKELFPIALMWLYITSVTLFARREAVSCLYRLRAPAFAGIIVAIVGLILLPLVGIKANPWYLLLVGVFLGEVAVPGWRAIQTNQPADIQAAVKRFILAIILFDACLVFAARGPLMSAIVLLLLIPSYALSPRFRST